MDQDEQKNRQTPIWPLTTEGRQCHCNGCYTQFFSKRTFSMHWKQCPGRVRAGHIEPTIYAS